MSHTIQNCNFPLNKYIPDFVQNLSTVIVYAEQLVHYLSSSYRE